MTIVHYNANAIKYSTLCLFQITLRGVNYLNNEFTIELSKDEVTLTHTLKGIYNVILEYGTVQINMAQPGNIFCSI